MSRDVDYSPFRTRPTADELASLREEIASGVFGPTTQSRYAQRPGLVVFAVVGGFLGLIFAIMSLVALVRGNTEDALIGLFFVGGVLLIGVVAGRLAVRSERRGFERMCQLVSFARLNSFEVTPSAKVEILPGAIFTTKSHAQTTERLRWSQDGFPVEVANHSRNSNGHSFAARYVAVKLGSGVPRMAFGCGVPGISGSGMGGAEAPVVDPTRPGRKRRRRATLISAPKNIARARELLTDELVGLLLDPDHPCNAETAGGYFFAYYHPSKARRTDENLVRHSVALAGAVVRADRARRASDIATR